MVEKRKICMLGAAGVGKSSLVGRFVRRVFTDVYRTTVGVVIDKRPVEHAGRAVDLIVWDLNGEDEFQSVQPAYLRGAAGYFLVVDGTRRSTVDSALVLQSRARATIGSVPFVLVLNKIDLTASWELTARDLEALERQGWLVARTSARTGDGVDEAFGLLVDAIFAAAAPIDRGVHRA
jgi:small GTP-binding protein